MKITAKLDARNRTLLDEYKKKWSVHVKNISELKVEACKKLQANNYHTTKKSIDGAHSIIAKRSEEFTDLKSTSENMVFAALERSTGFYKTEHLDGLGFMLEITANYEGGDPREGELWSDFQCIHNLTTITTSSLT